MGYINLTISLTNLRKDELFNTSWKDRGTHLLLVPGTLVTAALDTTLGGVGAVLTGLTLGQYHSIKTFTFNHLQSSFRLLSSPYYHSCRVINASIDPSIGYFRSLVNSALTYRNGLYIDEKNFWKREIGSRLCASLLILTVVIWSISNAIIGVTATVGSVLTIGYVPSINTAAYRGLSFTGIVIDVIVIGLSILNPGICCVRLKDYSPSELSKLECLEALNSLGCGRAKAEISVSKDRWNGLNLQQKTAIFHLFKNSSKSKKDFVIDILPLFNDESEKELFEKAIKGGNLDVSQITKDELNIRLPWMTQENARALPDEQLKNIDPEVIVACDNDTLMGLLFTWDNQSRIDKFNVEARVVCKNRIDVILANGRGYK